MTEEELLEALKTLGEEPTPCPQALRERLHLALLTGALEKEPSTGAEVPAEDG